MLKVCRPLSNFLIFKFLFIYSSVLVFSQSWDLLLPSGVQLRASQWPRQSNRCLMMRLDCMFSGRIFSVISLTRTVLMVMSSSSRLKLMSRLSSASLVLLSGSSCTTILKVTLSFSSVLLAIVAFKRDGNPMFTVPYLGFIILYALVEIILNIVRTATYGPGWLWVIPGIVFGLIFDFLLFISVYSFRQEILQDKMVEPINN